MSTATFEAENDIHQVVLDGRVVWEDGEAISLLASEVYETRHDYVGEMPANGETARADYTTAEPLTAFTLPYFRHFRRP